MECVNLLLLVITYNNKIKYCKIRVLNDKSEQLKFNSVAKKTTIEEYTFRKRSSMNDNHNQTEYKVMIQAFKNELQ